MSTITFDTESMGFSKKFVCGSICDEKLRTTVFQTKEEMEKAIILIGEKEARRGHNLQAYAHNLAFDFYRIFNLENKNIKIISMGNPPIIKINTSIEGKEINLIDSMGLFPKMSLEKIGEQFGTQQKGKLEEETKLKLFDENLNKKDLSFEELSEIIQYCEQDTKTLMNAIQKLKEAIKKEGIKTKRLLTIGQIAINHFNQKYAKKEEHKKYIFEYQQNQKGKWQIDKYHESKHGNHIQMAYRGGRIQAFQTGTFEKTTLIDKRSLYPTIASNMPFPDLKSEKTYHEPLKYRNLMEILNKIGTTTAIIHKEKEEIPSIPVRTTKGENYWPKQECKIIGTYTNEELKETLKRGHKIWAVKQTTTYEEKPGKSPLNEFFNDTMEKRKQNPEYSWFYKLLANSLTGKFAQNRNEKDIKIEDIGLTPKMEEKGYKSTGITIGYDRIFEKELEHKNYNYYAPIIPTYITAIGRITMLRELEKIKPEDLLYTNTDSILFKGDYLKKFKIGEENGEFKIEQENQKTKIYQKATYTIANETKISGASKNQITKEQAEQGIIKYKRMIGLNETTNAEQAGTFIEVIRDLKKEQEEHIKKEEELAQQTLFIDGNEPPETIYYFLKEGLIHQ